MVGKEKSGKDVKTFKRVFEKSERAQYIIEYWEEIMKGDIKTLNIHRIYWERRRKEVRQNERAKREIRKKKIVH